MSIIDFHAHILPGMDHGCDNKETAYKQLQKADKAGVKIIVATSHFYPHRNSVNNFLKERENAILMMHEIYENSHIKIIPAAEVLLCDNIDKMEGVEKLCIGDTQNILIELPMTDWTKSIENTLTRLKEERKLHIIIAHPDRYDKRTVQNLLQMGFDLQINASSTCKWRKRHKIRRLIKEGHVVAIGSDIHGADSKAYSYMVRVQKIIKDEFHKIMSDSAALLNMDHMEV